MILVTGGTGLVGSYILYYLLRSHSRIRAIFRNEGKQKNTGFIFRHLHALERNAQAEHWEESFKRIEWVECDILDVDGLNDAMQGVEMVFHTAAVVSFNRRDAREVQDINIHGTANVVNLCIENKISKLAYVSSTAALARNPGKTVDESFQQELSFKSTYSRSKYQAEMEVWRGIGEGLNAVIVNPGIILGWGNFSTGSIAVIRKIAEGFDYYTDGINGFIDARDVAKTVIQLAEDQEAVNNRYIAVSENVSYKELFKMIASEAGERPPSVRVGKAAGKVIATLSEFTSLLSGKPPFLTRELAEKAHGKYIYDNSKLRSKLNYAFIPISRSVHDAVQVYKNALP